MGIDALVTGGTGLIGRWLLPDLTADGQRVGVVLRGDGNRLGELRSWVDDHQGRGHLVHALRGDLSEPGLGLDNDDLATARTARRVFHLGAAMSANLPPQTADQVNVNGSMRLAELAASAPRLERLVLATGFRHRRAPWWTTNRYHDSKLDADAKVRAFAKTRGIPLTTVHPGPTVGDSRTGETTQLFGWPELVRALCRGRLPIVPGGRRHWLPLAAVDYVARFTARVPDLDDTVGGQYWLLHDDTPPLAELLTVVARELGVHSPRIRVPLPLAALSLHAGLDRWTGLDAESLPFISTDRYPVSTAQQLAHRIDLPEPDPVALACVTARYLVDHHFGH